MRECEAWECVPEEDLEDDLQEDAEEDDHDFSGEESSLNVRSPSATSMECYFKEMARSRMLNREEEVELAAKIAEIRKKIAVWIRRYPGLLPESLPEEEESGGPSEALPGPETQEITEALIHTVEESFADFVGRLDRAEAALRDCEARSGVSHQKILQLASRVQERPGAILQVPVPLDELLSMQASVLCALYDIRAVETATGAGKNRLRKDYEGFLEARKLLQTLKTRFLEANLRLVISVARKFRGRGVPFLDLIQEGNLGLMRAMDKFDHRLGFKFSTYASWWIRQAMFRAIQNQAQTIRTPVHVLEVKHKVARAIKTLSTESGSQPNLHDIAKATGLPEEKVTQAIEDSEGATRTISLETPIGGGDAQLLDFLKDEESTSPEEACIEQNLATGIKTILSTLAPREELVLRKRFGIGDEKAHTLEELGREFGLTRERIRQIETKALLKLRHPCRRKEMEAFADL